MRFSIGWIRTCSRCRSSWVSRSAASSCSSPTSAAWNITQPREGGAFLSSAEFEFSAEGIGSVQRGVRSFSQWQRVSDVTATTQHIYVWVDTFMAYMIPVRDLPAGLTAERVVAGFNEWMSAPASQESVELPPAGVEVPPVAASEPGPAPAEASSWQSIFRLLTLRRVAPPGPALFGKASWTVAAAVFSLALWVGLSWFEYLPEPEFFPYSIPALAWYVLAALAAAVTMAKRSHPQIAFAKVCGLLAFVLPVLIVADFAIVMLVAERWVEAASIVLGLYALVYCIRGLHALTGHRQPMAALGGLAVAMFAIWSAHEMYAYPEVWIARDDSDGTREEREAGRSEGEQLLFEQAARIDAAAARVEQPVNAAPAGFFVGFAGYGDQKVFAEEIKFAAGVFARRYDTADRTLLLINDRRDLQTQPLASVAGLRYALKQVASRMRTEQDVLFLALSSHGSEDPSLSVSNGMLPLHDLTGDALAGALRESGIKWRVIVISACHAGAFIEPLRDPYTVVITAAAPDRTSFGCSDERDLTYFGEAFFRDSLPQAASLREAFDAAEKLVLEREREEGFKSSRPQAFFGERIEQRLASMLRDGVKQP